MQIVLYSNQRNTKSSQKETNRQKPNVGKSIGSVSKKRLNDGSGNIGGKYNSGCGCV
jgi:hypothetical protein